ncbi:MULTISPECIES: T9SS type A sorting domain-containing protein [Winogradskyella]|uniref:DUF7619 domain-containing protein n=1 Tax=Winogradskyella TaxID=286104 RepID=UPI0015C9F4AD|nr:MULTISPECIES: T9SS type A sorting domain-containing protein [Winogradskyella]QXP78915.1 T9SS type A sorting domain-containing protein [Winogradskyella sp. HaHa_3_26]
MNRYTLLLSLALLFFSFNINAQCPTTQVNLSTQADIEAFILNYPNCSDLQSTLSIQGSGVSDITGLSFINSVQGNVLLYYLDNLLSLEGLQNITTISGKLDIKSLNASTDFSSLSNVTTVGGNLSINNCDSLTDMTSFSSITDVGGDFELKDNSSLVHLDDLNDVIIVGGLFLIDNNDAMTSINAFNFMSNVIEDISIKNNNSLLSVNAFNAVAGVQGSVSITNNTGLTEFVGANNLLNISSNLTISGNAILQLDNAFNQLLSVSGNVLVLSNNQLQDIAGFNSLSEVQGDFTVDNNDSLTEISGFNVLDNVGGNFVIDENIMLAQASGFYQLQTIQGDFAITYNDNFQDFSGFQNLSLINGEFEVRYNDSLINFNGLNSLTQINDALRIGSNLSLENLDGLENLTSLGGYLGISNNTVLTNVNALNNLESIGGGIGIGSSYNDSVDVITSLPFDSLTLVDGNININSNEGLTSLSGFNALTQIGGILIIEVNSALEEISGFNALTSIQDTGSSYRSVEIRYNANLSSVSGFNSLSEISNSLIILTNAQLQSVTGFQNLESISNYLNINENDVLTDITGFSNLTTITGDLRLGVYDNSGYNSIGNPMLASLEGLEGLEVVTGNLSIRENHGLISIDHLTSLTSVGGDIDIVLNSVLQDVQGLSSLVTVGGDIEISTNYNLASLQGLNALTTVSGDFRIYHTACDDFSGLESLTSVGNYLAISNNAVTTLNGLENLDQVDRISLGGNDNLVDISSLSNIDYLNLTDLYIQGNPQLSACNIASICNYLSLDNVSSSINVFNGVGCQNEEQILNLCATDTNQISGIITYDDDSDGCDAGDVNLQSIQVNAESSDSLFGTFTDQDGAYLLYVSEGEFTLNAEVNSEMFSTSPSNQIFEFNNLGNQIEQNLCIAPIALLNNLSVAIYPSFDDPRPGFNTKYQLVYNNIGSTQLSGSVSFEFNNSKLNFLSASETIASQTTNTLTFDFTDLNPFETRTIDLEFNVFAPPTTNIDDVLEAIAVINPVSGDETEEDNVFTLEQTVIGSYDPNDITVLEGEEITIEESDKYLHYLIRFQNTGTASAINVRVDNVLDNKLDWTTMQLESLSHSGRVDISNETDVSFIFDNINLADSTNDEPNSHGYIAYKIKPINSVEIGDVISGTADIFFDFNPAIITNTVNTEIVESLSVNEYNAQSILLFPNPANNKLEIKSNQIIDRLSIVDVNGRVLSDINILNIDYSLDVTTLVKGVYFLEIQSGESKSIKKFIKN